jgi:hypothetical protein
MSESPYKFLSPYEFGDADSFFGRDVETDVLLSDVVVNPLVVLFAKTGTGKTSLINAGVRPRLKARGYETYVIRTRADPFDSARTTLAQEAPRKFPPGGSLADQLKTLAENLKRPIVLFFDQFEEFFLYLVNDDVERAQAFVSEVADLYETPEPGVHLVFSLREEWFVDMGLFADRIPEIFHSDANLRLRWFDRDQARAAIVGPPGEDAFTPELVERLVAELVETGREVGGKPSPGDIEPAQLQIVCDTLWRARDGALLDVADYDALGEPGSPDSVARQVLDRRLVEAFERFETREELDVLAAVLLQLATKERTKRVREYGDLVSSVADSAGFSSDPKVIREVVERLRDARLVDIVPRKTGQIVELTHDYLVLRLDDLLAAIALIWPRRALADGLRAWRRDATLLPSAVLPELLTRVDELRMDAETGELLLRSALGHLVDLGPILSAAERSGAPVWRIIDERVRDGPEAEQVRAIESLTQMGTSQAFEILRRALDRGSAAPHVIRQLARVPQRPAVELLAHATERPDLAADARAALATLADSPDPEVAGPCKTALRRSLGRLPPDHVVPALCELDARTAAELLDEMASPEAHDGLVRLASGRRTSPARTEARRLIFDGAERMVAAGTIDSRTIAALEKIEAEQSVVLLGRIAASRRLADRARRALIELRRSIDKTVAARAAKELDRIAGEPVPEPEAMLPRPSAAGAGPLDGHFSAVLQLLAAGRLVPVLGAGTTMASAPGSDPWEPGRRLPSGWELASHLAERFSYPEDDARDVTRVAQFVEARYGHATLQDALRNLLVVPHREPAAVDRLLAMVPVTFRRHGRASRAVIVSLRFDDHLERTFADHDVPCSVLTYIARGQYAGGFRYSPAEGPETVIGPDGFDSTEDDDDTLIVKLFGGIGDPEADDDSLVITEDDHIEYAVRATRRGFLPTAVGYAFSRSSTLFMGWGFRDWSMRVLLRAMQPDAAVRSRSWAVMVNPTPVDVELWGRRDVDVIDMYLDEYAARLEQQLAALDVESLPS